jgi:bifunctional DNase/RNase
MQFEVSDDAAIEFAPALYGALAAGRPVDAAMAEARKAVYTVSLLEWATPVLYMRADEAHLFDVTGRPSPVRATTPAAVPAAPVPAESWIQLDFGGVRLDPENNSVVLLKEHNGTRFLPIQVGPAEAVSINLILQGNSINLGNIVDWYAFPYELLYRVLSQTGIQIWTVSINGAAQGEYTGYLVLSNGSTVRGKVADLIAIAIRTGARIYTSTDLLGQLGVTCAEPLEGRAPPYGLLAEAVARQAAQTQSPGLAAQTHQPCTTQR